MDPFGILGQARNWFVDRGRLKVKAEIVVENSNRLSVQLRVSAVNVGRRPLKIKKVAILLENAPLPLPPDLSPEIVAKVRQAESEVESSERILCLYDGENGYIEIGPDGDEHAWSATIAYGVKFLSKKKRGGEYGRGYILFTSGKQQTFTFFVLSAQQWDEMVKTFGAGSFSGFVSQ